MSAPFSARRRLGVVGIASVAAVAAAVLVPTSANAVVDPPSQTISFSDPSLASDGWTGPAATGSDYDFAVVDANTLRASNWTSGNDRGVITQLMAPTVQPVGEPFYTTATHDGFSASFTLDSALTTGDRYAAQPGLAIELDADQNGNRAGGGVTFRVTTDHVLEIANYYSKPVDLGEEWRNSVASVPFTGPLNIQYQVKFVAGGVDTATVLVNGVAVLSGGTFEGYTLGAAGHAETVNSILLRAVSREPAGSPAPASWNTLPLTDDQNTALKGNGFLFSHISYGSATSSDETVFPHSSTVIVQKSYIKGYEDSNPASPTFDYTDWHVTRGDSVNGDVTDPGPTAFDVTNHALQLFDPTMNGHSVQLVKGFDGDGPNSLRSARRRRHRLGPARGHHRGPAFFQLPFFIDGALGWHALPGQPARRVQRGSAERRVGRDEEHQQRRPPLHRPHAVPLSDILDALDGHDVQFLAFGIASSGGATARPPRSRRSTSTA